MARLALVLLVVASVAFAGPPRPSLSELSNESVFSDTEQAAPSAVATETIAGVTVSVAAGAPTLLVSSADGQWLMVNWAKVQEVGPDGRVISSRTGSQVLDMSSAARKWTLSKGPLAGSDPQVDAITASLTLPLKPTIQACSSSGRPSIGLVRNITLDPVPSIVMDLVLFGGNTNYTVYADTQLAFVRGNLKWNIRMDSPWPFCSATNKLVVELGLRSSAIDSRSVSSKSGEELQQEQKELANALAFQGTRRRSLLSKGESSGEIPQRAKDRLAKLDPKRQAELRERLQEKMSDRRPMEGFGRREDTKRYYLALATSATNDSKVEIPTTAMIDGVLTDISVATPSKGKGLQRVQLTFPHFSTSLDFDPTVAFAEADIEATGEPTGDPTNAAAPLKFSALLAALLAFVVAVVLV